MINPTIYLNINTLQLEALKPKIRVHDKHVQELLNIESKNIAKDHHPPHLYTTQSPSHSHESTHHKLA